MNKRNPIEISNYIDSHFREYLQSSFNFGDDRFQRLFAEQLDKTQLFKGPYLAMDLPFKKGKTIHKLIEDGVLCKSFLELNNINFNRPMYLHQEEAIRKLSAGRNAVVTTGTGSGKTECFLYPILNEILKDYENGNREPGIRAIFLYPMNALVNDQIDRIRKILTGCPKITFGFYTGDTEEKISGNARAQLVDGQKIPENELISREEIRNNPPHLLFTNYSMLEYMLIRPNDKNLFLPENLKKWKFVVLDEAHTYRGALGIEISMLLRRLTGMSEKKPGFILTSATLGEKSKSEKDIIQFARNLTSADFIDEDIIFSSRESYCGKAKYYIQGEYYKQLKKCKKNDDTFNSICKSYGIEANGNIHSDLYDLLYNDKNVASLYYLLKDGPKTFDEISQNMGHLKKEELIALIELINRSEKDGMRLFDIKYHSFVRPLAGAFISLGQEFNLSLTKVNSIKDHKAFELANCRYCNAPYIFGRIIKSDGLDYLVQNDEVDIYENYGNNEFKKLDYFVLKDISDFGDEIDEYTVEKYKLCPKCGNIYESDNLNAKYCDCDENKITVFRVKGNGKDNVNSNNVYNNITECPYCRHHSQSGIVRSLNLGKDEGTAFIAQTIYEAIGETEQEPVGFSKPIISLSGYHLKKNEDHIKSDVKQFLCFSDSRQQASFFATYFDAMHSRFLRKRIVWEVIKKNNFKPIRFNSARNLINDEIRALDLFKSKDDLSKLDSEKESWLTLLVDLLKVDGSYDSEGLGLYFFDIDLVEIMSKIFENDPFFDEYNISKGDLETIMQVVFGVFKTAPAIKYSESGLSKKEKLYHLGYRRFDNAIQWKLEKSKQGVRSFLPIIGSNQTMRYVQKVLQCNEITATNFLEVIFDLGVDNIFEKIGINGYQINAEKYVLKNYRTSKFYRCKKCGSLTPYNVHDKCPKDGCNGTLEEVNPDVCLKNNYYRKHYMNSKLEDIIVKEHTAQLNRDRAREYQIQFRNKEINILSSSTTFEMGIDIGGLDTVFMRNVPPSPANYVQRAGRAGRRSESTAYILTYCSTGSHDYTYYCSPEKMISGKINPPSFVVLNDKIIIRHLIASSLGFFFKKNPEYFKSMDNLVLQGGLDIFQKYLNDHPKDLNNYIEEKVIPEEKYAKYHNFEWVELICNDEKLKFFKEAIQSDFKDFEEARIAAEKEQEYIEAEAYKKQIDNLKKKNVISTLSEYCVIPKYGFPVDVANLKIINKNGDLNSDYDLNRDLKYAISEYAPGSEVIVDGNKYTSRYIGLPPKGREFSKHKFKKCPNCNRINIYVAKAPEDCKFCGKNLNTSIEDSYLEPEFGFKTGNTKESTRLKPKRTYAGEVSYIGEGIPDERTLQVGNILTVQTSSNDKLLVVNRSKFYMCPVCGYSVIANKSDLGLTKTEKHNSYKTYNCENNKLELIRLGHDFQTDVARIKIPTLDNYDDEGYSKALSVLYAILEGVSEALEIDRNDIDGIVEFDLLTSSYDLLLYDNVPGGAGHVKRLLDLDSVLLSLSKAHAKVSQNCCSEDTSCYNCLRNYYNQMYHSKIKRGYAKNFLEQLIHYINDWLMSNELANKKK